MAALVQSAPGTPSSEALYSDYPMTTSAASATKYNNALNVQDNLKRSFAKYSADHSWDMPRRSSSISSLFKPEVHLAYEPPKYVHTMEDIDLPMNNGLSPVAVSEPFRLFSEEAIDIMRSEVLCDEVQEKFSYTSDIAPKQIRGYAPKYVNTDR